MLANLDADSRMSAHLVLMVLMHWTGLRPSQTGRLRRDDFRLDESDPYVLTLQEKGALQAAMAAIPLVGDGFAARRRNVRDERVTVGLRDDAGRDTGITERSGGRSTAIDTARRPERAGRTASDHRHDRLDRHVGGDLWSQNTIDHRSSG